jgi:hypothetical protein
MPRLGFEPSISVFERTKTIHAFYCMATVIDMSFLIFCKLIDCFCGCLWVCDIRLYTLNILFLKSMVTN